MFLTDIYSHDGDKEEEADQTLQVLSSRQVCRYSKVYVHNQVVRYAGINICEVCRYCQVCTAYYVGIIK